VFCRREYYLTTVLCSTFSVNHDRQCVCVVCVRVCMFVCNVCAYMCVCVCVLCVALFESALQSSSQNKVICTQTVMYCGTIQGCSTIQVNTIYIYTSILFQPQLYNYCLFSYLNTQLHSLSNVYYTIMLSITDYITVQPCENLKCTISSVLSMFIFLIGQICCLLLKPYEYMWIFIVLGWDVMT